MTYDLVVNTIPPVYRKNISFKGGQHNTLLVPAPQGTLRPEMKNLNDYGGRIEALIRRAGRPEILHHQPVGEKERYLAGNYDVEILTLPRTVFKNVRIKRGELKVLNIARPAVLNLFNLYDGFLSFYTYDVQTDTQKWIHNLNITSKNMQVAMQPGSYKLVFRAGKAYGSAYPVVKKFSLTPGGAFSVDVLK